MEHDWPGNVRELRGVVERALLVTSSDRVRREDLTVGGRTAPVQSSSLREARDGFERMFVRGCLQRAEGNVAKAARLCDVSRETFYRLLRKHGIRDE